MIKTVNFSNFVDTFRAYDRQDQFSYNGKQALFDYLEELEDSTGEPIELDVIALCVEYTEYKDFDEFQHDTGYTQNGVEHKGYENIETLEDLKENTTVIEFNGGIIVQDF